MPHTTVAVVGHSFVSRLHADTRRGPRLNMALDPAGHRVVMKGRGGMVIPQLATNHLFWLSRLSPDLVIFDIGTNDLDTQAPAVTKLAEQLFSFGRKLVAVRGVSHVAFLEVLPRAVGRFQSRNHAF